MWTLQQWIMTTLSFSLQLHVSSSTFMWCQGIRRGERLEGDTRSSDAINSCWKSTAVTSSLPRLPAHFTTFSVLPVFRDWVMLLSAVISLSLPTISLEWPLRVSETSLGMHTLESLLRHFLANVLHYSGMFFLYKAGNIPRTLLEKKLPSVLEKLQTYLGILSPIPLILILWVWFRKGQVIDDLFERMSSAAH